MSDMMRAYLGPHSLHDEIQRRRERQEADVIWCDVCEDDTGVRWSDYGYDDPPPAWVVCEECEREQEEDA